MVIESVPKVVGVVYAIVATIVLMLLFRSGRFNKRIGYLFVVVSTFIGFLLFAPMLPNQFQVVLIGNTEQLGVPVALAAIVLLMFIALTFAFGRVFCGYVCPVGTLQELAYLLPIKKFKITNKAITIVFHIGFLIAFVILAVAFSIGLLKYLGFREFFYLKTSSVFFFVLLTILVISAFVYRPFCRFACPYGALLSLSVIKGWFNLRRNQSCINCRKCKEACPTNEVGWTGLKQECYMCHRCKDACPVNGIEYTRRRVSMPEEEKISEVRQPISALESQGRGN